MQSYTKQPTDLHIPTVYNHSIFSYRILIFPKENLRAIPAAIRHCQWNFIYDEKNKPDKTVKETRKVNVCIPDSIRNNKSIVKWHEFSPDIHFVTGRE